MRFLSFVAAALLALAAGPAIAQTPATACPRPAAAWSAQEANVWHLLCTTGKADITPPYGRLEPPVAGEPAPDYVLRATFLRQILTEPPYKDALRSVSIKGAYITGLLELTGRTIPMPVTFEETQMPDGLVMDQTQAEGAIAFLNSYFPAGVGFRNGRVSGNLTFDNSVVLGALDITNTTVNGNVSATNGKFEAFVGRAVKVLGSLNLDGAETTEVVLPAARIGTDANLRVAGGGLRLVTLSGVRVPGQLALNSAAPWQADARMTLSGASVGTLVPPRVWPTGLDTADLLIERVDTTLATWLLDRLQKSTRATNENYTQLATAARAGGAATLAQQIDTMVRERVRARASTSERIAMTLEDWGWFSWALGIAILAGFGWLGLRFYRRKVAEAAS
ncbi:MAG: hypothetical protein EXQ93_01080 [Alphaproteobacteria bacterium]|nr:hypothetical protein [Alphaproteobacteria bacterium]